MNPGMDAETFDQFIEQLRRYVRERLIPAFKPSMARADEVSAHVFPYDPI